MAKLEIYKAGQGKYTRILTVVGAMVLVVVGAVVLSEKLYEVRSAYIQFGIPAALVIGMGLLMFWVANRPKSADFLIATEGEMKKVSWSTRKEIIGSTKVVIVTTLILALILYGVDAVFAFLFMKLGIMGG